MRHTRPIRRPYMQHIPHYPRSAVARAIELFLVPAVFLGALFVVLRLSGIFPRPLFVAGISFSSLALASWLTLMRLLVAYVLALVFAIPLALAATHSSLAQKILLPLFDVLQSVPVLAFFPILVAFFVDLGFTNGATILILFVAMLWNIVFAVVGGIGLIPKDIAYAAEVFGLRGFAYLRRIVLPAIVPQCVIGSILALAQGWNIIIVAEVIRTYLPPDSSTQNLFGLGSLLVSAAANGQVGLFLAALAAVVLIIALINFFIWQRLLKYAQRFKFE